MPTFSNIDGQEPSTVTFKLATVTQTRNSTLMHQEIMSLGDPDTSNAIAAVLNSAPASTAWALATRPVGTLTIQGNSTVAPLAGSTWATRPLQSSAADLQMTATPVAGSTWNTRPIQSSAADLQMTATPVAGSTWRTQPGSTLWASSAGFHFDSSGALQIAGSITATAGSTVSTGFISVRISDGSTWVVDYAQGSTFTSTLVAGGVNFLRAGVSSVSSTDVFVMPWGSTFGHQVIAVTDSSQAIVYPADSANNALRVNVVAGTAASTIVTVAALPLISSAVAAGNSSALTVRNVWSSTNADQPVSAAQAGTWNINTVTSLSSLSTGHVTVDTGSIRVVQSSAAELLVTATIGTNLQSSVAPSSGSSGLRVRPIIDDIAVFASTSALASTSAAVVSSAANIKAYVVAYSITSTNQTPAQWGFFSSNGTLLWPLTLAALSSGVAGANLAVSAPAYLFKTAASEALNFKTAGSTVSAVQLAVSYFLAP